MNGEFESMDSGHDGRRFVAGWLDGNQAGRSRMLRTFRRTAASFGWTCDEEARVLPLGSAVEQPEPFVVARDNPEGDVSYDDAFDRAEKEVVVRWTRELLSQLAEHGLFVAYGGTVTDLESASQAVIASLPGLPNSREVTDEALHAFLDEGSAVTIREPGHTVAESAPLGTDGLPRDRTAARSWRPDRRQLVAAGAGALMTGALMRWFGGISVRLGGSEVGAARAQAGGAWVPPAWWDDLPPTSRNFYLAWDQLAWNLEQTPSGTADLHEALRTFLLTPGFEDLKRNMVVFFEDSQRVGYHWDLLHALVPGVSTSTVHAMVFSCLTAHVTTFGPSVLTTQVRDALVLYRTQGLAPTPSCQTAVNHVLSLVGL